MTKTGTLRARIDPELKAKAEKVFRRLGLSPSDAIAMFYAEVVFRQDLPFKDHIPNEETIQAMRDLEEGRNVTTYEDFDEFRKAMGL
jgi:DNA-damage-inducible protein J